MSDDAKGHLRKRVRERLDEIVANVNRALKGQDLERLRPVLERVGRGMALPHWYAELASRGVLPNLDGKTIGSVVEMLFVAVLETHILSDLSPKLRINPARGVD